jgi:hypothetical protein
MPVSENLRITSQFIMFFKYNSYPFLKQGTIGNAWELKHPGCSWYPGLNLNLSFINIQITRSIKALTAATKFLKDRSSL